MTSHTTYHDQSHARRPAIFRPPRCCCWRFGIDRQEAVITFLLQRFRDQTARTRQSESAVGGQKIRRGASPALGNQPSRAAGGRRQAAGQVRLENAAQPSNPSPISGNLHSSSRPCYVHASCSYVHTSATLSRLLQLSRHQQAELIERRGTPRL